MMTQHYCPQSPARASACLPRRWWHIFSCFIILLIIGSQLAQAGVVKSTGVKRIVDGPQGEVEVTGVLDDQGVPVSITHEPPDMSSSATNEPAPEATPQEPDVSQIEYHDTPQISQEDTVKKEDNGMLKLIAVGLLVLLLGLCAVFFINKRD